MDLKVLNVRAELVGHRIRCEILVEPEGLQDLEYAFYINKGGRRIHTEWYKKSPVFEYDVGLCSGYYQVHGFVRSISEGWVQSAKSIPIFANPVETDGSCRLPQDHVDSTYLLRGSRWSFPAIYYPGDGGYLFVLLPSAVDRSKVSLPVFSRWTWAAQGVFPGRVLCIADPTLELNDKLNLGWCLGDKENYAAEELAGLIYNLADAYKIPAEKIIFYGSSAGGFAALSLAAYLDGAVAVAINAQTDILRYHISSQVDLVRQCCFGGLEEEEIRRSFLGRVDMSARWSEVQKSKAVLVQNELDVHHYQVHFRPFWLSLGGSIAETARAGRHISWIYRDERGHVPESIEMAREIVALAAS